MSSDWSKKLIGEMTVSLNSKRVPVSGLKRKKMQGEYRYYGASGVVDYVNSYIFDGKYLLVSEDGENLRTRKTPIAFIAEGKYWVNNHAHILDEKEEGIIDYLECYFKYLDISPYLTGAVQPKLNQGSLERIEILFPKKEIRLRINKVYNELKQKIELNNQINNRLERISQSFFKSWFINFDPVHAKKHALEAGLNADQAERAAMAIISGVCSPIEFAENFKEMDDLLSQKLAKMSKDEQEKLRSLAALFPSEFEVSELGEIPKGWEVCTIESVADVIGGGTPSTSHKEYYCETGSGIPWLSPKDLSGYDWKFIKNGATDITELGLKKSSARLMPEGTVVISSRAPIGYVAIAEQKLCTNQGFKSLVPKNKVATNFLYNWAKLNIPAMEAVATGSTFKEISGSNMKNLKLVIPPKELALSFEEFVHASAELQKNLRHETNTLEKLRDTLLPRLLAGEINLDKIQLDSKEI